MAIIRKRELQSFGKEELERRINELRLEQLKLKAQKGQSASGTHKSKELKRTMARIYTRLNQIKTKT
jgi:ribosomal protein L29